MHGACTAPALYLSVSAVRGARAAGYTLSMLVHTRFSVCSALCLTLSAALAPSAFALEPRTPLDQPPIAAPQSGTLSLHSQPQLLVKLKDGVGAASAGGGLTAGAQLRAELNRASSRLGGLISSAESLSGRAQPDFGSLFVVDGVRPDALVSTANALAARDDVEVVWIRNGIAELPRPEPRHGQGQGQGDGRERQGQGHPDRDGGGAGGGGKGGKGAKHGGGAEDPTASYLELQRYLRPNPGIDAQWAWQQGYNGQGLKVSDVEYALNLRHEELGRQRVGVEEGVKPVDPFDGGGTEHGTAVMGIVVGQPDKSGIRGIANGAEGAFYPIYDENGLHVSDAILAACGASSPGDIVMIELQDTLNGRYVPMETDPGAWMATRTCTDAGVVVIAAAGNGSSDLEAADLAEWRKRGDSGAILVGAGTGGTTGHHDPESFSNYGPRVNVQGWGSSVFTLGYGDHAMVDGDENRKYTAQFSGTSSATPIVAGAAALVQQAAKERLGRPLTPEEMRSQLARTGVNQDGDRKGHNIGPLPNVRKAIEGLDKLGKKRPTRDEAIRGPSEAPAAPIAASAPPAVPWWAWLVSGGAVAGIAGTGAALVGGVLVLGLGVAVIRRIRAR